MANESIELLKNYSPAKMAWPAGAQEKLDGVPAKIVYDRCGFVAVTRQNEVIRSIGHIIEEARELLGGADMWQFLVGELYIPGMPFKQIGGLVRQYDPAPNLKLHVFDYGGPDLDTVGWHERMHIIRHRIQHGGFEHIELIPWTVVYDAGEADTAVETIVSKNPDAEGVVLHSLSQRWNPGKRNWGVQRIKVEPTIDLRVVGFEEAISKDDQPLGMVGRVNVELCDKRGICNVVGVGPGKLTHKERTVLWEDYNEGGDSWDGIAQIKYMKDPTYDALRQATFQCWRPDKTTPDVYER